MSNVHAFADVFDCGISKAAGTSSHPVDALRRVAAIPAKGLIAAFQNRQAMRRMERFSDHLLEDMGFTRDWDGSITRRPQ